MSRNFAERKKCLFFDKNYDCTELYHIYIEQLVSVYNAIAVFIFIISSVCSWISAKIALRKKENYESRMKKSAPRVFRRFL